MTTQFASASYQEIVDLHTESDTVSVIGIHTPQGDTPRKMFGGFFDQFKKFKYLGCSIKLVPAARLPADPLQVSAQYDDYQTIDPRDMLNPLMFHGCHGNDMGVILNRLYSLNSVDGPKSDSIVMEQDTTAWTLEGILAGEIPNFQLEDLYYKALTDNTWKKAHPQRGFRKSGLRPLVYKMSTNMQMLGSGQSLMGLDGFGIPGRMIGDDGEYSLPVVQSGRQFFTPGLTGLGWLDTRNVLTQSVDVDYDGSQYDSLDEAIPAIEKAIRDATLAQQTASESSLPLVYMGMILLPPAYKTEQYFRMIINHHFAFKDFRGISFSNNLAVTPAYDDFNNEEDQDPDDPDPPTPDPPTPDPPIGGTDLYLSGTGSVLVVHDGGDVKQYSNWGVDASAVDQTVGFELNHSEQVTHSVVSRVCVENDDSDTSELSYYFTLSYEGSGSSGTYYLYADNFTSSTEFDVWLMTGGSSYLMYRNGTMNPNSISQVTAALNNLGYIRKSNPITISNTPSSVLGYGALTYEVVS